MKIVNIWKFLEFMSMANAPTLGKDEWQMFYPSGTENWQMPLPLGKDEWQMLYPSGTENWQIPHPIPGGGPSGIHLIFP